MLYVNVIKVVVKQQIIYAGLRHVTRVSGLNVAFVACFIGGGVECVIRKEKRWLEECMVVNLLVDGMVKVCLQ